MVSGFNPMRWNCDRDGCFNKKRRPKIEVFADCFPGGINFGDVDGLVEISGAFCLLEWKADGGVLKEGQRRSYVAFTRNPTNVVFVVHGDAETMKVRSYFVFWGGTQLATRIADLEELKDHIRKWVDWVRGDIARKELVSA